MVLSLGTVVFVTSFLKISEATFKRIQIPFVVISLAFCVYMFYPGAPDWQFGIVVYTILAAAAASFYRDYFLKRKWNRPDARVDSQAREGETFPHPDSEVQG